MAAESQTTYEAKELLKLQPSFLSINWENQPSVPASLRFKKGIEEFMQNVNVRLHKRSNDQLSKRSWRIKRNSPPEFKRRAAEPWLSIKQRRAAHLNKAITPNMPQGQEFKGKISTILNKMTAKHFAKFAQLTMEAVTTEKEMNIFITMILELSVKQPTYCTQYVRLCDYLRNQYTDQDISKAFRKMIIIHTNDIFHKHQKYLNSTIPQQPAAVPMNDMIATSQIYEKRKEHFFAVLILIAELFNFNLIHENILYIGIFGRLLPPNNKNLSSVDVEGLCHMFMRCGKKLESESQRNLDKYLEKTTFHARVQKFDFRTQALVNQANEMRNNHWLQPDDTVDTARMFERKLQLREIFYTTKSFLIWDKSATYTRKQAVNVLPDQQNIQEIIDEPQCVPSAEIPHVGSGVAEHKNADEVASAAPPSVPSYGFIPHVAVPVNATDEGKESRRQPVISEHDSRLNVLFTNFIEIDSRFKAMTQHVTTAITTVERTVNNDMKGFNQQFMSTNATITNVYKQMTQQIQILSNKLTQTAVTQQHTQQSLAHLRQQIAAHLQQHSQQQSTKDNQIKKLLQHINEQKSNDADRDYESDGKIPEADKVRVWFAEKIRLKPKYFQLFVKNGYDDLDIIADMNQDDLREIGVQKIGHRKKILKYIKLLNAAKQQSVLPALPKQQQSKPRQQLANVQRQTTPKKAVRKMTYGLPKQQPSKPQPRLVTVERRSAPKKSARKINFGRKKRNIMPQNAVYVRTFVYLDFLCSSASDGIYESLGFREIVSTLIPISNRLLYKWIVERAPVFTTLSISNWNLELGADFVTFIGNDNILTKQALFRYNNPYGLREFNIRCGAASKDWLFSICLKQLKAYLENKENLQTVVINIDSDTDTFSSALQDGLINLLRSLVAMKTFIVKSVPFQIKNEFVSALCPLVTDLRLYDKSIAWAPHFLYALKSHFSGLRTLGVCVDAIDRLTLHIIADIANELIIKDIGSKRKLDVESLRILFAKVAKIEMDASLIDNYPSIRDQNKTNVQILSIQPDNAYDCILNLFENLPSSVKHLIIKKAKYSPLDLGFYEWKQTNRHNTFLVRELTFDGFDDIQQIEHVINCGFVSLITVNIMTQSYKKSIQVEQQIKSLHLNKKIKINIF